MHHFVTVMCTRVHITVTKWCIVGNGTNATVLCNRSRDFDWLMDTCHTSIHLLAVYCHQHMIVSDLVWGNAFIDTSVTFVSGHYRSSNPCAVGIGRYQSGRSPKVVAHFSATNLSSFIIELLQLHDAIKIKWNYAWIHQKNISIRSHLMI